VEFHECPGVRPPETLDDAWAEAEAALPEGGYISRLGHDWPDADWFAKAQVYYPADETGNSLAGGRGPTPAAALRALAAKLKEI
jgi:hypothetical protein